MPLTIVIGSRTTANWSTPYLAASVCKATPLGDGEEGLLSPKFPLDTELAPAQMALATLDALRSAGYEVLGELGRGGMGVVYLANKLALNRLVRLKMILAGPHAGSAAAARFRAEAEAVARLRHPGIVQIYHVGEAGGLPFLELEYVPGGSLDQRSTARLVRRCRRADGRDAGACDRRGAPPGDRSSRPEAGQRPARPGRMPQDRRLRPGQADRLGDGLTRTRAILGSPSYMAPEQAEGHAARVGPRPTSTRWGHLYELLTGRPPFRAATPWRPWCRSAAEPVPPSRFQPGLRRATRDDLPEMPGENTEPDSTTVPTHWHWPKTCGATNRV